MKKLATLRRRAGLNQSQLAQRANVSRQTVINCERGNHEPTVATLKKLACALGVSVSMLLYDASPPPQCEYCDEAACDEDPELGRVCHHCLAEAVMNEEETGIYAVGVSDEPDWDLLRDRRDEFGWDDYEAGDIPEDDETMYRLIDGEAQSE